MAETTETDHYAFAFEGQTYRMRKLLLSDARVLQKVSGSTIGEFEDRLQRFDADCIAALVWLLRKRTEPTLKYSDVDGDVATFEPLCRAIACEARPVRGTGGLCRGHADPADPEGPEGEAEPGERPGPGTPPTSP